MIFEQFEKQTAGRPGAPHFTLNMARLYWFQASWRLQELEDDSVTSWVLADGLLKSVPMALVQATLRRSTAGLHHARNQAKVKHMWKLCDKLFQPDGDHWSLRQSAAPEASGPASDAVVTDDEEIPDWGGSSENEPEDEHAAPAAGQTELRQVEALISPTRPDPTDPPISFPGWVQDLTPTEYAAVHDVPSFATQWRLAGADIARMTLLKHVEHLMPQPRRGSFVWNFPSDKPAPHMRRDEGTRHVCGLQGGAIGNKHWTPWIDALGSKVGWVSPLSRFLEVFRTWIQLRPAIACRIRELRPVTPHAWQELGMMTTPGYIIGHSRLGYWLRMTFDDVNTQPTEVHGGDSVRGWHGTSMYCIARVIQQRGLSNGFAQNSQGGKVVQGVFYMHAAQAHLCETYMHYCMLNEDGWLVSPLLELCVNEEACLGTMTTVLKRRGGGGSNCNQRIADANHVSLHSVLFHVMHVSELIGADKNLWLAAEPGFHPLLELDPYEPWQDIVERSRERRNLTFL